MITVDGLSFEYPGLRALDDVSFHIEARSITALVGPNGAGKSTLMRCIAGMDRPVTGTIRVDSIDVIDDARGSHKRIGYLSDFYGLYDELSVRRCLHYAAAANGVDDARVVPIIDTIAADLGLAERLDQRAGDLSRGLRQRVAIGQAVIHAPQIVILDEPASGLDPEARYELGQLFLRLKQRGMTLLVSSHILAELEAYSSHMLVLRSGTLIEHRAIGSDSAAAVLLELGFLGAAAQLERLLVADERIAGLERNGDTLRFAFNGDLAAQAALLKTAVEAGIQVTRFQPVSEDLQRSYLQSIAKQVPAS